MKINFMNWWENDFKKKKQDFFFKFCKIYIDNNTVISDDPDIIFCSVFGKKESIINHIKNNKNIIYIFFTGENTQIKLIEYDDYLLDYVNISLGFKYIEHPKYIRFPLWLTYINFEDTNMGYPCLTIPDSNNMIHHCNPSKFCCMLASHDTWGTRSDIFTKLNNIIKVDSGGNYNRNIDYEISLRNTREGPRIKKEWISQYKFNICCENSMNKGYITEKIFESILSGCIPIYKCSDEDSNIESDVINQDIIIKFTDSNIDTVVEKILEIHNNNNYDTFINNNILTKDYKSVIQNYYNKLSSLIKHNLGIIIPEF